MRMPRCKYLREDRLTLIDEFRNDVRCSGLSSWVLLFRALKLMAPHLTSHRVQVVDYNTADVFKEMAKRDQQFDIIYDTIAAGDTMLVAAITSHPPTISLDHDTAPMLIAGRYVWEGAASGALAPGGQLVTITGDTQGVFSISELLTRGYQMVSRKLYCWLVIGGGASYHQVSFMVVVSVGQGVCYGHPDPILTPVLSNKRRRFSEQSPPLHM